MATKNDAMGTLKLSVSRGDVGLAKSNPRWEPHQVLPGVISNY